MFLKLNKSFDLCEKKSFKKYVSCEKLNKLIFQTYSNKKKLLVKKALKITI